VRGRWPSCTVGIRRVGRCRADNRCQQCLRRAERGSPASGSTAAYVYEAWIGCHGEGFARSVDGGAHFSAPITLPDSSGSDDPAISVARDGTVYVSYLRYHNNDAYPVVATSFDHGATFTQAASLIAPVTGNWGDRDFIAAGRGGTVYVTWDYGPSAADVNIVCAPTGSCAYSAVDATAVIQKSTDHGKTWGPITPMQPGFPAGGGYDASIVVQPNGVIDALVWGHQLDPGTFTVHPGHEYFTSSTNGGKDVVARGRGRRQCRVHRHPHLVDRRESEHGPGRESVRHLGYAIRLGRQ
jgi:hypothetical protein